MSVNGQNPGDAPWGTAAMKTALTEGTTEGVTEGVAIEATTEPQGEPPKRKPAPEGWIDSKPMNYEEFSAEAAHDWDSNARVYEWDGEQGDVGPEYPELELELFGEPSTRVSHGLDFSK